MIVVLLESNNAEFNPVDPIGFLPQFQLQQTAKTGQFVGLDRVYSSALS